MGSREWGVGECGIIDLDSIVPVQPPETILVGYWPLSEGSGTLAREKAKKPQNRKIYGDAVWGQSMMPIIGGPDAKEGLLNSTGLEDYGYWWKKLSEGQADKPKVPFRRGRIWT